MGTYNVIYHGNGNILGSVPIDNNDYDTGNIAIVLDNTNNLSKPRFTWGGWNTSPDGTGTSYFTADTITIAFSDVILYALWIPIIGLVVVYDGNGNTLGNPPIDTTGYVQGQAFTVLDNAYNLSKVRYFFSHWNTSADGTGTNFYPGDTHPFPSNDITLYAMWSPIIGFIVIYDGNENTSGEAPIDSHGYSDGETFSVLDNSYNLSKTGYTFGGWNTSPDGTGSNFLPSEVHTFPSSNITLYAKWLGLSRGMSIF